jgi:DMSO/TMAO reductase YedYZ molybdopterin-dependent catalytic subunit
MVPLERWRLRSRAANRPVGNSVGRRRDRRRGALAGGLAALVALAVAVALRDASGAVSFLDAAAEALLDLLPLRVFAALLALFGTAAKAWLLFGLLAAFVLGGVAAGRAFAGATAGSRRVEWPRGLVVAAVAWIGLALLILWRYGGATGGPLAGTRPIGVVLVLTLVVLAFGLALPLALSGLRRLDPPPLASDSVLPRRRVLTWFGLGVSGAAALLVLARDVDRVRHGSQVGRGATGRLPEPITPIADFYVVSKNFRDPDPDREGAWSVEVDGAVDRSLTLDRDGLAALAGPTPFEFVSTLTCISNPVGGPLISTARWTGVPLAAVLTAAGVVPDDGDVVFHGRDGYADSIPLAKALAPETALVWAMNGEELPRAHGHPLRAIVPGRYGIKNVKWIARISVEPSDYEGYWQRRGWTDEATIKTMSRIDVPADKAILSRSEAVASGLAGIAFAGDRDVAGVEVSLDGGDTWQAATIVARPGPLAWVLWRYPWQPAPGTHRLLVRAADGRGDLQTAERADPLPDGASGWHETVAGVA